MKKFLFILILIIFSINIFSQNYQGEKIFIWDNAFNTTFNNPDNPEQIIGYAYNIVKSLKSLGFEQEKENLVIDNK